MAKLVIEKWQCDRCGNVADEKPGLRELGEAFTVHVTNEVEWAGGNVFKWTEMCRECNRSVGAEIAAMRASAATATASPGHEPNARRQMGDIG